jgi:hypothetical protein
VLGDGGSAIGDGRAGVIEVESAPGRVGFLRWGSAPGVACDAEAAGGEPASTAREAAGATLPGGSGDGPVSTAAASSREAGKMPGSSRRIAPGKLVAGVEPVPCPVDSIVDGPPETAVSSCGPTAIAGATTEGGILSDAECAAPSSTLGTKADDAAWITPLGPTVAPSEEPLPAATARSRTSAGL